MIDRNLPITIVGAGLGGLTAALALQRAGFRPIVFEQAAELGDVGAGISVTPNATKGLEWLGLGVALAKTAQIPPQQVVRDGLSGAELLSIDRRNVRERYGAAYYMLHRAELHAMLVAAVVANDQGAIRTSHALRAISVAGTARLEFADRPAFTASIVIAADGARSLVRTMIFGSQPTRFTGHIAWRLLVPADAAPADARLPGSIVWAGAERSFVRYPVRGGALINCVGLTRSGGWADEGWSQRVAATEMAAEFADFVPAVTNLIAAAPGGTVGRWGLFVRPPVAELVAGSVALLGDAAHPMLPFMGQGAAMAIEDGVVLGRCFAAAATPAEALARYQAARLARVHLIQAESAAGADRLQQSEGDGKRLDRNEDSLGIFDYDPASVPL
jgi:salicylate hydroxylase